MDCGQHSQVSRVALWKKTPLCNWQSCCRAQARGKTGLGPNSCSVWLAFLPPWRRLEWRGEVVQRGTGAWSLPDLLGKMLSGSWQASSTVPPQWNWFLSPWLTPASPSAPHSNISTLGHLRASLVEGGGRGRRLLTWGGLACPASPAGTIALFLGQPCDLVSRHLAEFSKCSPGPSLLVTLFTLTPLGP